MTLNNCYNRLNVILTLIIAVSIFGLTLRNTESKNSYKVLIPSSFKLLEAEGKEFLIPNLTSLKVVNLKDLPMYRGPGQSKDGPNIPDQKKEGLPFRNAGPAKVLLNPQHSAFHANLDLLTVPLEDRKYLMYFSAYNFPKEHRRSVWETLSFTVNSLSTERAIKTPVIVANTDDALFRIDIRWYGWDRKVIEELITKGSGPKPLPEPYFYMTFVKAEDAKVEKTPYTEKETVLVQNQFGQLVHHTREVTKYREVKTAGSKKTIQAIAPWISPISAKTLSESLHTTTPIVRADWFIVYSMFAPMYYKFLGVKDRKEKELKVIAIFDEKNTDKVELRGTADTKVVALNNRILVRVPTIASVKGAYWWESNDFSKSVDEGDVHNNLFATPEAKEIIFSLRNGLQAYGLSDKDGNLVDVAPPQFAQDTEIKNHDKQVYNARNCVTCHQQGIRTFKNKVKELSQGTVALLVAKEKDAKKVEDKYFSYDIEDLIKRDQLLYAEAVASVNGLTAAANATQFDLLQYNYLENQITLSSIAYETGIEKEKILDMLKKAVNIDHTLVGLLKEDPISIRREQFERRGFPQLAMLIMQANLYSDK